MNSMLLVTNRLNQIAASFNQYFTEQFALCVHTFKEKVGMAADGLDKSLRM